MWVFLAIQVLFLLFVIAGAASHGPDTGAQTVQLCDGSNGNAWYPLYQSYSQCLAGGGQLLAGASDIGKGLAVAAIIGLWVVVDIILALTWLVVRLSRRPR
jgi:hypothetical protein